MKLLILATLLSLFIISSLGHTTDNIVIGNIYDANNAPHLLWPIPASYNYGRDGITIMDPCNFAFNHNLPDSVSDIFTLYQQYMFSEGCPSLADTPKTNTNALNSQLTVTVANTTSLLMELDTDESYNLTVQDGTIQILANTYVGALRGLETFSQLLSTSLDLQGNTVYSILSTPVVISDAPRYTHRGFMLDTARHFQTKEKIFTILDGMMFSKLNVFHWHLSDSDSFPFFFPSHPNLTQFGAFSPKQVYSQQDIQDIVSYATLRGIRIIPEIDSPAHVGGMAYAPEAAAYINCTTAGPDDSFGAPLGQINPIKDESYALIQDLLKDLDFYFPWSTVHLGSDEVDPTCWNNTEIYAFMAANNLTGFPDLFNYYVQREKELVSPNKTRLYWLANVTTYLKFEPEDILQWWDTTPLLYPVFDQFPSNRFILSNSDAFYLDCGYGDIYGNQSWCDPLHTWFQIYKFAFNATELEQHDHQIIGVEACLWSEMVSDAVVLGRVFPRISALAERAWSPLVNDYSEDVVVVRRLNAWIQRNNDRGVPTPPITTGYCEKFPERCFL